MLFILFALGTDAGKVLDGVSTATDQIAAVGSFFGHFIYSFFLGVTIVVRSFASQMRPDALAAALLSIIVVVSLAYVSQKVLRIRRA